VLHGLANVPSSCGRPFHLAWNDLGPGVFQVVKTTQSRGRTERTLLNAMISVLRRRALAGTGGMLRTGVNRSLRWYVMLCYPSHQAGER
jgi:hypothetical protein